MLEAELHVKIRLCKHILCDQIITHSQTGLRKIHWSISGEQDTRSGKRPSPTPSNLLLQKSWELRLLWHSNRHALENTQGRKVRSKIRWFTEFCNSHYLSHFAAFFIDGRTKRSVVKSCILFMSEDSVLTFIIVKSLKRGRKQSHQLKEPTTLVPIRTGSTECVPSVACVG